MLTAAPFAQMTSPPMAAMRFMNRSRGPSKWRGLASIGATSAALTVTIAERVTLLPVRR
jgi:hypothetical protein